MKVNKAYASIEKLVELYNSPMMDLMYQAATVHRENHNPNEIQMSSLISIKTGGCSEDCGYCPQAARYNTELEVKPMMSVNEVIGLAKNAKQNGSARVCMGAAWREVRDNRDFDKVVAHEGKTQGILTLTKLLKWFKRLMEWTWRCVQP